MKQRMHGGRIAGMMLHLLIGGLLIFTGSEKVLGLVTPEALANYGLGDKVGLIGEGAFLSGLLLVIPRTTALGVLSTSSFWGGTICIHLAHDEPYVFQAVALVLLWLGTYLRNPAAFSGFSSVMRKPREDATASEAAIL
jgi:hypothetical protein